MELRRLITVFTRARQWSLSWGQMNPIHILISCLFKIRHFASLSILLLLLLMTEGSPLHCVLKYSQPCSFP
jgi:hypothetical protein